MWIHQAPVGCAAEQDSQDFIILFRMRAILNLGVVSGIFPLMFADHGCPWVTETADSKSWIRALPSLAPTLLTIEGPGHVRVGSYLWEKLEGPPPPTLQLVQCQVSIPTTAHPLSVPQPLNSSPTSLN